MVLDTPATATQTWTGATLTAAKDASVVADYDGWPIDWRHL